MSTKSIKVLAGVIALLLLAYLLLNPPGTDGTADDRLLPDFKTRINDVTKVVASYGDESATIEKQAERWTVSERNAYTAIVGALREALIGLADAKIVERKTSDADKYHLLGVEGPGAEDSESVLLTISGDGFEYGVILGDTARASYRYARLADADQSVLIDQNPAIPDDTGGWLDQDIVDLTSQRVQSVTTTHSDGETFEIRKENPEDSAFQLVDIPEGRELSYPTAANGIGGALAGLTMDDVRQSTQAEAPAAVTSFTTFDGLTVDVSSAIDGEQTWISVKASADIPDEISVDTPDEASADIPDERTDTEGDAETGATYLATEDSEATAASTISEDTDTVDVSSEADKINQRLSGWQFRIADYKANLLKRRVEDILKAQDDSE